MGDHYLEAARETIKKLNDLAATIKSGSPHVLIFDVATPQTDQTIAIDKRYYRIDFINETESSVDIRITRK